MLLTKRLFLNLKEKIPQRRSTLLQIKRVGDMGKEELNMEINISRLCILVLVEVQVELKEIMKFYWEMFR